MKGMSVLEVSKIITDEYSMKILAGAFNDPKTASELSIKFEIPIAACYRKIRILENFGLLECTDKMLPQDGRGVKLYRSLVKDAFLFYESGKLRVCLNHVKNQKVDFDETWDALNII